MYQQPRYVGHGAAHFVSQARAQRRNVLWPILGLAALGFCALLVVGLVAFEVGVGVVLMAALAAMLPVVPVVATFLWMDRWEPEPPKILLFAFLWGAGFSALTAMIINTGAALVVEAAAGGGEEFSAVISAPIVEEGAKGAFLLGMLVFRRRELDGVVDGIVYAGLTAAGFAFTENILYFGKAMQEAGQTGLVTGVAGVLIVRGLFSPFAHPLFTSMIGIGVGVAANARGAGTRLFAPILGYVVAVVLHSMWNLSATLGLGPFVMVYVVIMVPLFGVMLGVVVWQRRREQRLLAAELPGFAHAGLIAPQEVGLLADLSARRRWRNAAKARMGRPAAKAVTAYQAAATELAFLRARMAKGVVGPEGPAWHQELVRLLADARAEAINVSAALPATCQPPGGWAQARQHTWSGRPVALPGGYGGPHHPGPPPGWGRR